MTCNLWELTVDEFLRPPTSLQDLTPIQQCCGVCAFVILGVWAVSEVTLNYSQVDKLWSIVPFLYAWIVVKGNDDRTFLIASLVTLWGGRLTFNFTRRGGYKWPPWTGDEDYRYVTPIPVLQSCRVCCEKCPFAGRTKWETHPFRLNIRAGGNTFRRDICFPSSRIQWRGSFSTFSLWPCFKICC